MTKRGEPSRSKHFLACCNRALPLIPFTLIGNNHGQHAYSRLHSVQNVRLVWLRGFREEYWWM